MTEAKEAEYARLAEQVAEIEKLIRSGARRDAGYLLTAFMDKARARMDAIASDEQKNEYDKRERKERDTATIVKLIERESMLDAEEKKQYGEFLKLDHFTKDNLDDLERFYSLSWNKLSDEGREHLSHRVWEGIRHEEYTFAELPEEVRKKEAERLYSQLTGKIAADPQLQNIPQSDQQDFVREHEAGNQKAAAEVLSRETFTANVSSRSEPTLLQDMGTEVGESGTITSREILKESFSMPKISPVQDVDEVTVPPVGVSVVSTPGLGKGG